ncbi:MAG: DUF6798 domain-containing protein [Cyanobacteria bacterium J06650_10]
MAYGYSYAKSNIYNQVPVIEALIDSSLFTQDFYIQEMTGFTPRFYYYQLVIFLHHLGISIPIAKFGLFLLAFGSLILGLWSIGKYLAKSAFAGVVLAFLSLAAIDGTLGFTDLFRVEPISAIYAMGITVWGIYFCCRRQWRLGYLVFGVATLLQFLIGFLPACLWGISLLLDTVFRQRSGHSAGRFIGRFVGAFALFSLLVAMVYVPMAITGNTSSDALTDSTFVQLYGYIRHPHHIVLSSFPAKDWRDFIFLSTAGLCIIPLSDKLSTTQKRDLYLTLFTAFGLLFTGYFFVEKVPIALVAKLQFARVTPFAMLTVWMALSVVASEYHERKNYPVSLLLIVMPLVDKVGPILLFVFVLLLLSAKFERTKQLNSDYNPRFKRLAQLNKLSFVRQRNINIAFGLFFVALLACWSFFPMLFASLAYPLLKRPFPAFFQRSRSYFKVATVGLALYLCLHLSGAIGGIALTPLHRKVRLYAPPDNDIAKVAAQFREISPTDALVLVPPSDQVFRFYAKRSVVATFKSFPFTDSGIVTWRSRLEEILGPLDAQMMSEGYTHERYRQRSSEELMQLAQDYRADYLLTQSAWHPELRGEVVAQTGDWVVWQLE